MAIQVDENKDKNFYPGQPLKLSGYLGIPGWLNAPPEEMNYFLNKYQSMVSKLKVSMQNATYTGQPLPKLPKK